MNIMKNMTAHTRWENKDSKATHVPRIPFRKLCAAAMPLKMQDPFICNFDAFGHNPLSATTIFHLLFATKPKFEGLKSCMYAINVIKCILWRISQKIIWHHITNEVANFIARPIHVICTSIIRIDNQGAIIIIDSL